MKTQSEVSKLKENWLNDPCWDIEDTEGFEEYHDELLAFRKEQEAKWEVKKQERRNKLREMLCPMSFNNPNVSIPNTCQLEDCAWWNEPNEMCAIRVMSCANKGDF